MSTLVIIGDVNSTNCVDTLAGALRFDSAGKPYARAMGRIA